MTMDKFFLALHVFGAFMWVGGLFAVAAFLEAHAAEPDATARGRLIKFVRQAALVPDIGATIAIVFGAHWLFRFKLYQAHYMHPKLALVAVLIGLHVYLRLRVKRAKSGEPSAPPSVIKPVISVIVLAILTFVIAKWPA